MKRILRNVLGIVLIIIMSLIIVNLVESEDKDAVKGNITIWVSDYSYDYINKSAQEFKELNAKANIEVVKVEGDEYKKDIENINNHTNMHNMPDMIELNSRDIVELSKNYPGKLYDVNNIIDVCLKNYTNNRVKEVIADDNILGIPIISRPLVLYLRQDLLREYGYNYENIATWDDFIAMGKDIYARSNGSIKLLNAVGKDYEDLISVLIMQAMEGDTDKDKIKENVDNNLGHLIKENILNTDSEGKFLARISSINAMRELSKLEEKCEWTANDMLSQYTGSNRFYVAEGKNFVILKENEKTAKLIRKFVDYLSNNTSETVDYVKEGDFFLSFLSTYRNKDVESSVNNFIGRSPIVVMDNINKKAPAINNYELYFDIKKKYID